MKYLLSFFLMFTCYLIQAQTIIISGTIQGSDTQASIPFAHVFFKGTQVGTSSDIDGNFEIKVKNGQLPSDSLVFQYLGYKTLKVAIEGKTTFEVVLEPNEVTIKEFTVVAGENPAFAILDKMIANKSYNDPNAVNSYTCNEYSKIRFDLNHFTEDIKKNILVKPFDYIWDNTDTTEEGVAYLPVLLVEKSFRHYYQSNPQNQKTILEGKKVTGLPGPKIMEFAEDLYFTPNVYDNYVVILDKNFPSPINNNYKTHYDYLLMDSNLVEGKKEYTIDFHPKHNRQLAFTGRMIVDAETYAVKSIRLRFDIMANVNFVRSYLVEQHYAQQNGRWMPTSTDVIGDFTVVENSSDLTGFFGRKHSTYTQYTIDQPIDAEVFNGVALVEETHDAEQKDEEYWEVHRTDSLDEHEKAVENMVNQLENDPKYIFRKNLFVGIATGYIPIKKTIDIGNFYTFYSYNYVEHSRLKLGFRTSNKLDFPLSGSVYGAYGIKDDKWKYGIDAQLKLGAKDKTRIGVGAKDDIIQLGRSFNAISIDHVLTSLVQIGGVTSRIYEQKYNAYVEQELFTGFVGRVNYFTQTVSATDTVNFRSIENNTLSVDDNYRANGLELTFKFSWQNTKLNGAFYDRDDLKKEFRKFPDVRIQYTHASKALGSDFNYEKVKLALSQNVRFNRLGYFKYYIEGGKTFGKVPYPFLDTPFSNQLVLADNFAFNLMKYMEFVADEYVTVNLEHHFDGAILDAIPLVNRLKWRSFLLAKGYWGNLSAENFHSEYLLLANSQPIAEPYYEIGFGFENIFKIARMDFVWRLNDTTLPDSYTFIVKPSFSLSF